MATERLSLICPDNVIDPRELTDELSLIGNVNARQFAGLFSNLVVMAGASVGNGDDSARRFATEHGADEAAADRFVKEWNLCNAAVPVFQERVDAGGKTTKEPNLFFHAQTLLDVGQGAKASGLKAVLDYLLGIIAVAHDTDDVATLTQKLEKNDGIVAFLTLMSVLSALIAVGRITCDEAIVLSRRLSEASADGTWADDSADDELPEDEYEDEYEDEDDDEDDDLSGFISPSEVFTTPMVSADEVLSVLNRLGKRHKRLYAWMHNRLVAVIRLHLGKNPEEIKARLLEMEGNPVSEIAARQWREILKIRDALTAVARTMRPVIGEAERLAQEAAELYAKKENEPACRVLKQLLCLADASLNAFSPHDTELMLHFGAAEKPDSDSDIAVRCAIIASGDSSKQKLPQSYEEGDDNIEDMECLLLKAREFHETFFDKLPKPHQNFFVMTVLAMLATVTWLDEQSDPHIQIMKKIGEYAGDEVIPTAMKALTTLGGVLTLPYAKSGEEFAKWPDFAPGESEHEYVRSLADSMWNKSLEIYRPDDMNLLRSCILYLNVPLGFLRNIPPKLFNSLRASLPEPLDEMFPLFLDFINCLTLNVPDLRCLAVDLKSWPAQ